MDKDKFAQAIQEIGQCEDETQRRTLLAKLNNDTTVIFDENETLKTEKETLKTEKEKFETDNENLRKANMDLFLQIGAKKTDEERKKDTTGIEDDTVVEKKFEDLFDEKGGIK